MILQAVSDLGLDPARCVIVGDQMSDIEAGMAAGLGLRILLAARPGERKEGAPSHEVVADLSEAVSPIGRLNLPLPSAITMARRCSLQLALRAGMLGSEAKVG
jgi:HAD-hyrolase-like